MNSVTKLSKKKSINYLAKAFENRGYARYSNESRKKENANKKYKKGDEIRLIFDSNIDCLQAQEHLKLLGFTYGKSYQQFRQIRLPIYGRDQVKSFLDLIVAQK